MGITLLSLMWIGAMGLIVMGCGVIVLAVGHDERVERRRR